MSGLGVTTMPLSQRRRSGCYVWKSLTVPSWNLPVARVTSVRCLLGGGYSVTSRDIIDRGYGEVADFLAIDNLQWDGDIITNPPYAYAQEFVEKALQIIPEGKKVCMFLKLTFLEGRGRKHLFRTQPPARVWVSSSRLLCAMNGEFDKISGSATAYAWFVWVKGYQGDTVIKWFN